MPLNVRFDEEVAILSNVGRSMNDPRYNDAGRDVAEILDGGCRKFVIEMRAVRETGPPLLGVLMTVTRLIRGRGGEVVLGDVSKNVRAFIEEMRLDDYWDVYDNVGDAREAISRLRLRPVDAED